MVTPAARREAVAHLRATHGVSERRACLVLGADRTSIRYRSRRPDDVDVRERLRALSRERRRFGYRRLHLLLAREGIAMNQKKLRRLYREEKLQVRRRGGQKRALGTRAPMALPDGPNQRWSLDFVSDAFVVQTLERVSRDVGYPKTIRVDNGSEFISRDLDLWAYAHDVTMDFSRPGKSTDNAYIESFNGSFRAECLNTHWFMSLDDAREKLEVWRRDYNEVRPHSAIGNKPPIAMLSGSCGQLPA